MHYFLLGIGSAGDVHPFVGIGVALKQRGHTVTLAANDYFRSVVERAGLDFVPVGTAEHYRKALTDPNSFHPRKGGKIIFRWVAEFLRPMYDLIVAHVQPGKTVLVGSSLAIAARIVHEKSGIPLASVHLSPSIFRSYVDPPVFPGLHLTARTPNFIKWLAYWGGEKLLVAPTLGPALNTLRAELGLPKVKNILYEWLNSPRLVLGLFPDWFAPPPPDWPKQVRLTGFPLFDERGQNPLPPGLDEFLSDGEAPIAFTPGSAMAYGHDFFAAAVDACGRLKRRGLMLTRHREQLPAELPPGVRHFDFAPFSEVLPRCAALVHHGGIGTSAQGLASGVPHLVMPMAHDQPDNANRLQRLGVGSWLARKHFRGPAVAEKLDSLLRSAEVAARCKEAAGRIATSQPLEVTCRALEALA